MRTLHGAIKNALDSEDIGDFGFDRRRKRTLPFAVGS